MYTVCCLYSELYSITLLIGVLSYITNTMKLILSEDYISPLSSYTWSCRSNKRTPPPKSLQALNVRTIILASSDYSVNRQLIILKSKHINEMKKQLPIHIFQKTKW